MRIIQSNIIVIVAQERASKTSIYKGQHLKTTFFLEILRKIRSSVHSGTHLEVMQLHIHENRFKYSSTNVSLAQ